MYLYVFVLLEQTKSRQIKNRILIRNIFNSINIKRHDTLPHMHEPCTGLMHVIG